MDICAIWVLCNRTLQGVRAHYPPPPSHFPSHQTRSFMPFTGSCFLITCSTDWASISQGWEKKSTVGQLFSCRSPLFPVVLHFYLILRHRLLLLVVGVPLHLDLSFRPQNTLVPPPHVKVFPSTTTNRLITKILRAHRSVTNLSLIGPCWHTVKYISYN